MTVPAEVSRLVRTRAEFACEYCGVTESDTGGELTIDHFHPQSRGGSDGPGNLVYCCHRCNSHKSDYWPSRPTDPVLWNPRQDPPTAHFVTLADGTLYGTTAVGRFTINRLRLNRPPLVANRRRRNLQSDEQLVLARYRDVVTLLEQLREQHAAVLDEHRALLDEHRALLRSLLRDDAGG